MTTMMNNRKKITTKPLAFSLKTALWVLSVAVLSSPVQAATQHRVKFGETLDDIALRYNVSQTSLIDANGFMAISIRDGYLLQIPDQNQRHNIHKVERGDSLKSLSKKYNINSTDLAMVNNLSLQSNLFINSTVIIPAKNRFATR